MLSELSNPELLNNVLSLVREERKVMKQVLLHLVEIERRKLFASEGYSSLFTYCQGALGYSESEAYYRIASMRLLRQIPDLALKLEEGSLNITTLTLAHSLFKKEKEEFNSLEKKRELLESFSNKSKRQCEKIVAQISPEAACYEKERPLSEGLTELRIPVNQELLDKLKRLQEITGKDSYGELLGYLADLGLKKKDPALKKDPRPKKEKSTFPAQVRVAPEQTRRIPARLKREVFKRDQGCCSWTHPETKTRCQEKRHLQYDHIRPWMLHGETTIENLRLLCFHHHQLLTLQTFGREKVVFISK